MEAEDYKKLAKSRGWNPQLESISNYLTINELFEYGKKLGFEYAFEMKKDE